MCVCAKVPSVAGGFDICWLCFVCTVVLHVCALGSLRSCVGETFKTEEISKTQKTGCTAAGSVLSPRALTSERALTLRRAGVRQYLQGWSNSPPRAPARKKRVRAFFIPLHGQGHFICQTI